MPRTVFEKKYHFNKMMAISHNGEQHISNDDAKTAHLEAKISLKIAERSKALSLEKFSIKRARREEEGAPGFPFFRMSHFQSKSAVFSLDSRLEP